MNNRLLEQVYQQYYREILVYLYTLCKDHDIAEELMQETFLKAVLSLPDNHPNVRAWLYMVARNLCFNRLKHDRHAHKILESAAPRAPAADEPEEAVLRYIDHQNLYRAILQLDSVKREIIILHYMSEMSYDDISRLLGLSPSNLRSISYRAKKTLKKIMEEYGYDLS